MDLPYDVPKAPSAYYYEISEDTEEEQFDDSEPIDEVYDDILYDEIPLTPSEQVYDLLALKARAFSYMDRLEGWCSKEKASLLIDIVTAVKPIVSVEIGVFGGKSLIPVACALQYNGQGTIFGVDPWKAEISAEGMEGENYDWWLAIDHEIIFLNLVEKIEGYGLSDYVQLIRSTSEEAPLIGDIDLLHIDGNHSEKTSLHDVMKWVPLVNEGGIIIFDDIDWASTSSAVQWLDENCTNIAVFKGDNIWGIWVK